MNITEERNSKVQDRKYPGVKHRKTKEVKYKRESKIYRGYNKNFNIQIIGNSLGEKNSVRSYIRRDNEEKFFKIDEKYQVIYSRNLSNPKKNRPTNLHLIASS